MKKNKLILLIFLSFITLMSLNLNAQETDKTQTKKEYKTLFSDSDGHIDHGFFGGVNVAYSQIDAKPAISIGGRIAWLINHKFALGIAGNGFFNNMQDRHSDNIDDYFLAGGYGGLFIQPIISPHSPIHVSFPIVFGIGGVVMESWKDIDYYHDDENDHYSDYYDDEVLLVFEPGIEVDFNLISFMRMSVGASYRLTSDVKLEYNYLNDAGDIQTVTANSNAMNGFNFKIGMYFGMF